MSNNQNAPDQTSRPESIQSPSGPQIQTVSLSSALFIFIKIY